MAAVGNWTELGRRMRLAAVERDGDRAFQVGRMNEAEASWRLVLQSAVRRMSARNKLAILCMKEARFAEARSLLEDGIHQDPATSSFHYNMALLLNMEGDLHGSLESLAEVERLSPGHADVHFLKGVIYQGLGLEEMARKEFVEELNVDPATPAAWARLAKSSPEPGVKGNGKAVGKTP